MEKTYDETHCISYFFSVVRAKRLHYVHPLWSQENESPIKEGLAQENFAGVMKYETNFDEAVKKAKKSRKNVTLEAYKTVVGYNDKDEFIYFLKAKE